MSNNEQVIRDLHAGKFGLTIGDCLRPAMKISTKKEAGSYFAALVVHMQKTSTQHKQADEAARIVLGNLGYFAGYYDNATRKRVESLFGALHPIFGSSIPTVEKSLQRVRNIIR